jgi:dihydrofolate reductase
MVLSLIAAIGKNREIGKNNALLWHLPNDFAYFKKTTEGHPVIMGRKTFEAIGRPLPNRQNVVVTGDQTYMKEGVTIVHSLEEALALFKNKDEEVFIIGGAQIYTQALPYADNLYLTEVDAIFDADTFFPEFEDGTWEKVSDDPHLSDEKHQFSYNFVKYKKRT